MENMKYRPLATPAAYRLDVIIRTCAESMEGLHAVDGLIWTLLDGKRISHDDKEYLENLVREYMNKHFASKSADN